MFKSTIFTILLVAVFGCDVHRDDTESPVSMETESPEELRSDLFIAVMDGDFSSVKALVSAGADLQSYDDQGYTALMRAVQIKNTVMVESLVAGGSKVFQPRKDVPGETVLTIVDDTDSHISKLLFAERDRVLVGLETLLKSDQSEKALPYTKENYIPASSKLPGSEQSAIFLLAESSRIDLSYSKYLADEYPSESFQDAEFFKAFSEVNSKLKNVEFFKEAVKLVEKNRPEGDVGLLLIAESFDLPWLVAQVEEITKQSLSLQMGHVTALPSKLFDGSHDREESLRALNSVVGIDGTVETKNEVIRASIGSLSELLKSDKTFLGDIQKVIAIWKSMRIPRSTYSLDSLIEPIIKSLVGKNFEISDLQSTLRDVHEFAAPGQVFLEESLRVALSGSFIASQKAIVVALLSKVSTLPPGILAYAIRNSSGGMDTVILNSETAFDPSEQEDAILAAVETGVSGDAIYGKLQRLKGAGISTGGRSTQKALLHVFKKTWVDESSSYIRVSSFLQNLPSNPVSKMVAEDVEEVLKTSLQRVRDGIDDLSTVEEFLNRVNPKSFKFGPRYSRIFSFKEFELKHTVSFAWDLILTLRDLHLSGASPLEDTKYLVEKALKKFPDENLSMRDAARAEGQFVDLFLTEKMLPLALILTLDMFDKDVRSIFAESDVAWTGSMASIAQIRPSSTIWSGLPYEGSFIHEIYQDRPFWKSIATLLLDSERDLGTGAGLKSSIFLDSLRKWKLFESYPGLLKMAEGLDAKVSADELRCVFHQDALNQESEGYYPISSSQTLVDDPIKNKVDSSNGRGGFNMTKLGSFKMLGHMKNASCNGTPLFPGDIAFLKSFIPGRVQKSTINYDEPKVFGPIVTGCNDYVDSLQKTRPYSVRVFGVLGEHVPLTEVDVSVPVELMFTKDSKCLVFPHDSDLHNEAKLQFVSDWYACAASKKVDEPLIGFFKSLESSLGIGAGHTGPKAEEWKIKTCDYETGQ